MASARSASGEETVHASHILIKHEGSRRKAFWKDPEGQVISATTCADAAACLGELRAQFLAGRASFADLAAQHSDCSSARCNVDLDLVVFDLLHSAFVQSQNFSVITSIVSTFWFGS
ncbi:Peptidyl-prolyl cis-trans isomerase 1 [Hordeum vulgare]|nr:Peptidyl-prolyl cis-trans isomerase 1 [Hordeum vulgare]